MKFDLLTILAKAVSFNRHYYLSTGYFGIDCRPSTDCSPECRPHLGECPPENSECQPNCGFCNPSTCRPENRNCYPSHWCVPYCDPKCSPNCNNCDPENW